MNKLNRRSFIKNAAFGAAAVSLSARSWSQVQGSNSDVRFAVIGFNARGGDHIKEIGKVNGARLAAVCDADDNVLTCGVAQLKRDNIEVQGFKDMRKLLESKEIDA